MPRAIRSGVGVVLVALLFAIYFANAPPLVLRWEAGAATSTVAAGWYDWPQWLSALLIAATSGLTYAAAVRLGASPVWTACAGLLCGLGWAPWTLAVIPSAKTIALLLVGLGVAATAAWGAPDRLAPRDHRLQNWASRRNAWLLVAGACLAAGAWMQSLLPVPGGVRMSTSAADLLRVFAEEFRPLGLILAAAGAVQLWSRARRAAAMLGAWLAGYLLLAPIRGVSPEAVLVPASLPLWIAVAFGLQWIARAGPRRPMLALAVVVAVLLAGERWLLNGTLLQRAATPFFPGSLALSLAAISSDGTLLSDGPATDRRVARAAAVLPTPAFHVMSVEKWTREDDSPGVFAFQSLRAELEAAGRELRTVSRRVPLSVFLRTLPEDSIVAIALTPLASNVLSREPPAYFAAIGAPDTANAALASALIGRARRTSGALVQQDDREAVRIGVSAGMPWGDPLGPSPIAIDVAADRTVAAIAIEGREILRATHGGAIVVTSPEGLLRAAAVIAPEQRLQVALPPDEWAIAELVSMGAHDPPLPDPFFAHPLDASALVLFDGRDHVYFKSGWHAPERSGATAFMWTSEAFARLQIPLTQPLELRVMVELSPATQDVRDPPLVGLHVNGQAFDRQPALPGRRTYEWRVPETAWQAGANDVAIELTKLTRPLDSPDQRLLGAAVSLFRLERVRR